MRNLLFIILSLMAPLFMHGAGQKPAQRLTTLLQQMQKREEVTPDSFFSDVRLLRETIQQEQDATAKAIYQATLAHLLRLNSNRAQVFHRNTTSHPDSIQEWSREEYREHSNTLYQEALKDISLLHKAKTAEWIPLVERGRDEAVYGGDMLSVVWKALNDDLTEQERRTWQSPGKEELVAFYRSCGLREAALRLELQDSYLYNQEKELLLRLKDEYQDIPACALVYKELIRFSPISAPAKALKSNESYDSSFEEDNQVVKEKLELLREGIRRYPTFSGIAELRNSEKEILNPFFYWRTAQRIYYPDSEVGIPFEVHNMQSVTFRIYRLPEGGVETDLENAAEVVRQKGKLVKTIQHPLAPHQEWETWKDTLQWTTPSYGEYAILVEGKASAGITAKAKAQVHFFNVSALDFFTTTLPNGKTRLVVVDAKSGEPQQGVEVTFYREDSGKHQHLVFKTDKDGKVETAFSESRRMNFEAQLKRGEDRFFERRYVWSNRFYHPSSQNETIRLNIFTDRSIYRPGQTVYVAGVAYKQKEWDAQTLEGREYNLTFFDANRQKLSERNLKTDEYGVFSDTLQLPEKGLPGQYQIRIGSQSAWIRVEEYRRPTFRVEMDEAPALQWPADSITLSGRAMTYSGVPVTNARVSGTFHWSASRWQWRLFPDNTVPQPIDTVFTDQDGHFEVRLPLDRDTEQMKRGQMLCLSVDVLSPQGETQQGQKTVPLCTTPLRIWGSVPMQQDKGRLSPWTLNLYSSTDKPVEGTVKCTMTRESHESHKTCSFELKAGVPTVPERLSSLPSGRYKALFTAEVDGNKAEYETEVTLFSEADTRLAVDTTLWVYCPEETFSSEQSARIQIGTSLTDAWIHCMMTSDNGLDMDTIVHLQDSVFVWKIPYKKEYGKGASLSIALYYDGVLHSQVQNFRLKQPDMALRPHWDTFRDHLRPGEHEEWRLSLRRPDGTPARANVLLSLYDASLDALVSHTLRLSIARGYNIPVLRLNASGYFSETRQCILEFPLHLLKVREFTPSVWNEKYFPQLMFARNEVFMATGARPKMRMAKTISMQTNAMNEAVYDAVEAPMAMKEAASLDVVSTSGELGSGTTMRLRGTGEDDVEAEEYALDDAAQPIDASMLRQNLNELAFFMPQLRTDDQGITSIAFTLPESLTSWHLTGFAHTQDLMTVGIDETIVAQKELMAELVLPRFLRNGDEATMTAVIRNVSDSRQTGTATWQILDAETEKVLASGSFPFDLAEKKDTTCTFAFKSTMEHPLLTVRWLAKGETCSDGEQRPLAVLSDLTSITETKSFSLNQSGKTQIDLQKLFSYDNEKAVGRTLTVEYTARPVWLALQSLPSLAAPVHRDVLSLSSAYYAGSLANYIAQSVPGMKEAVEQWSQEPETMKSPLERNQELTDLLLQETPWVVEAQNEARRHQRLQSLFRNEAALDSRMILLSSIRQLQQADGSLAWFPGMSGSEYLTISVAYMLTRLGIMTGSRTPDAADVTARQILDQATGYLQKKVSEEVKEARKHDKNDVFISRLGMQYLYIAHRSGWKMGQQARQDADYLLSLLRRDADKMEREQRALTAVILSLASEQKQAEGLLPRLRELINQADGTYLAYPGGSFTSIDRKIQTHVQVIEAFQTVAPQDTAILRGMTEWLLQQKRTQEWEQPAQTADAVYALMTSESGNGISENCQLSIVNCQSDKNDVLTLRDGRQNVRLSSPDTPLGYLRERLEVKSPRNLTVEKKSDGLSWGAVYAQYQMHAESVEAQHEGLNIRREVTGNPKVGSRQHIRYVITADRDYEYVRLMAPRPAAAEPDAQLSGYRWQTGIGYYRAIHDASTEYFIDRLPRGTYVIEEDWLIARSGHYQLTPAILQCLYAPEYQAHSSGEVLEVRNP